jgi:hypothetical protein
VHSGLLLCVLRVPRVLCLRAYMRTCAREYFSVPTCATWDVGHARPWGGRTTRVARFLRRWRAVLAHGGILPRTVLPSGYQFARCRNWIALHRMARFDPLRWAAGRSWQTLSGALSTNWAPKRGPRGQAFEFELSLPRGSGLVIGAAIPPCGGPGHAGLCVLAGPSGRVTLRRSLVCAGFLAALAK